MAKESKGSRSQSASSSANSIPLLYGMKKWCQQYIDENCIDEEALQKEVDDYINQYYLKTEKQKQEEKAAVGVADDEGWIKVTRRGKKPGIARTEAIHRRISRRERKKKQQRQKLDFYTFQAKQLKKDHITNLRKKFEEDKRKVQEMKSARKFKPF